MYGNFQYDYYKDKMYFFIGAHESYKLNDDISNYYVEFDKNEVFDSHDYVEETITNIGEGRIIKLDSPLLENSNTIVLSDINSRTVNLKRNSDNKLIASTTFKDFPNLLLWHSLGSKMICIEPWMNNPDSPSDYEKELKDKKNVLFINPSEEKTLIRTITYYVEEEEIT